MSSSAHKTIDSETLHERLRKEIQRKMGVEVVTSRFFKLCALKISKEENARVSASTLKRYWQYVRTKQNYCPNQYSMDVLARFAGHSSWQSFCKGEKKESAQAHKTRMAMEKLLHLQNQMKQMQRELEEINKLLGEKE